MSNVELDVMRRHIADIAKDIEPVNQQIIEIRELVESLV